MGWGGARKGAGRPKADIPKKFHGIRLTDDEWDFVKAAVKKYRDDERDTTKEKQPERKILPFRFTHTDYDTTTLLAHLEYLYREEVMWMKKKERALKDDYYDGPTESDINLYLSLIRLQIFTLLPHLESLHFDHEVKQACSSTSSITISQSDLSDITEDIKISAWQNPKNLEYEYVNGKLAETYGELRQLKNRIWKMEREQNRW